MSQQQDHNKKVDTDCNTNQSNRRNHRRAQVEIDLSALQHNARVAKQLSANAFVMSAIKANAYGHGMLEVASALKGEVDEFAVASMDDVLAIRDSLPECDDVPITILSGFYSIKEIDLAMQHNASLVVYDVQQVVALLSYLASFETQDQSQVQSQAPKRSQTVQIWLKVDTGMSRLGLTVEEFDESVARLESVPRINLRGVISHFANADQTEHELNKQQLHVFEQLCDRYAEKAWHWSLANSAAILRMSDIAYDWVRPGIMLYGSSPFIGEARLSAESLNLKAVMSFTSEVISVRQVKAGSSIGYGSVWKAEQDTQVAVIACGYGDGYPRVIKDNTPVLVAGQRTRILGRVSMDLIVIDMTGIKANIGSHVELWGKNLSIDEIAQAAGTISYELLCNVTERVERKYRR